MEHRSKPSFWDRDELLETVKETYQQLHGERPQPGLYDDLGKMVLAERLELPTARLQIGCSTN